MAHHAPREIRLCFGHGWVLSGIVVGLAAFNTIIFWLFPEDVPWEPLEAIIVGAWAFEPMLFAIWAALGPGRIAIRAPLIIPGLLLVISAPGLDPGNLEDVDRFEYVVLLVAAFGVFAAVTLILLLLRRFTGWRIERISSEVGHSGERFQFDTKYLLALVTLCGLALGTAFSLQFGPTDPPGLMFGPQFYVHVMAVGSAFISLLLLPIVAVPLAVLVDQPTRRFCWWAAVFWLVVTAAVSLFWFSWEGHEAVLYPLVIQFGAASAGFAAALPLRWAGCRLVIDKVSTSSGITSDAE